MSDLLVLANTKPVPLNMHSSQLKILTLSLERRSVIKTPLHTIYSTDGNETENSAASNSS